jgi:poly [ADP-ribose] polymerase
MFGYGIYFADQCRKSVNYTSIRGSYWARGNQNKGYISLFKVNTGNMYKVRNHASWMLNLDDKKLKKIGPYDSIFAEGGADLRNNEYVVYNQEQVTIKYIVEIGAA